MAHLNIAHGQTLIGRRKRRASQANECLRQCNDGTVAGHEKNMAEKKCRG